MLQIKGKLFSFLHFYYFMYSDEDRLSAITENVFHSHLETDLQLR